MSDMSLQPCVSPRWGKAGLAYSRVAPAHYADELRVDPSSEAAEASVTRGERRTPLAARLKAVYGSVDRVDAFVGMIAEPHRRPVLLPQRPGSGHDPEGVRGGFPPQPG
jgi:hypothetical protein